MRTSSTDRQWARWGEKNSYLGVLGVESSQIGKKDIEAEFFGSGESHIASVFGAIARHFPDALRTDAALDFGCGVGRLILPLSRHFRQMTGVGISPEMIELAKKSVVANPSVDFVQHVGQIEPSRRYDLVHSYIVLQNIPPQQGYPIISNLVDRVAVGGFFALRLTISDLRPDRQRLNALRYRLRPPLWAYNLIGKRPWQSLGG